jgi:hypothetical protein
MEKLKATGHAVPPESRRNAPLYHSPTLTAYGSVAKLTQGGSGSTTDGVNTMMIVPPGQEMMM